ncbi:glycoside hydrolase domain-containing protein [Candidatus Auribacterota bacterium]
MKSKLIIVLSIISFFVLLLLPKFAHVIDKGPPFRIYSITPFIKATYDYLPSETEKCESVHVSGTPGEYEPATFSIYALSDLSDLSVSVSDLAGRSRKIPMEYIDVRVVKVWKQSGDDMWVGRPVDVPELLLYDDSVELKGRRPSIGAGKEIKTNIPRNTSKQFWVTVRIPDEAKAGEYKGNIHIICKGEITKTLQMTVDVQPFKLAQPDKYFLIYYYSKLDPKRGASYEPPANFFRQLKNIREHGFTGASIYSGDSYLNGILMLYSILGFKSPIPYLGEAQDVKGICAMIKKNRYLPVLFYGIDEPNTPAKAEKCRVMFERIKARGGRTMTAIRKKYADIIWDSIDVPNYSLCDEEIDRYIRGLNTGELKKNRKKELYYWQINKERPKTARFMCGFYLWKSKLDGICPCGYQVYNIKDPYDDFTPFVEKGMKWRPHFVAYPSKEGPVDTLQWEACREGIDDMKYIATLENNIRLLNNKRKLLRLRNMKDNIKDVRISKIEKIINENTDALRFIDGKIDVDCMKALSVLTEGDLADFRLILIKEINKGIDEIRSN